MLPCVEAMTVIHCLFLGNDHRHTPELGPLGARQAINIQNLLVGRVRVWNNTPEGKGGGMEQEERGNAAVVATSTTGNCKKLVRFLKLTRKVV